MGSLGSRPSLKMGGFKSGHSQDLDAKNNQKYLFKTRVFSIWPGRKNGTKNCIFFKRGSFGAAQVEKLESLGVGKAEKWGASCGTHPYCPYMGVPSTPRGYSTI